MNTLGIVWMRVTVASTLLTEASEVNVAMPVLFVIFHPFWKGVGKGTKIPATVSETDWALYEVLGPRLAFLLGKVQKGIVISRFQIRFHVLPELVQEMDGNVNDANHDRQADDDREKPGQENQPAKDTHSLLITIHVSPVLLIAGQNNARAIDTQATQSHHTGRLVATQASEARIAATHTSFVDLTDPGRIERLQGRVRRQAIVSTAMPIGIVGEVVGNLTAKTAVRIVNTNLHTGILRARAKVIGRRIAQAAVRLATTQQTQTGKQMQLHL